MNPASRSPVLVGCGQVLQRVDEARDALEPLELIARAITRAGEDCDAPGILGRVDSIRIAKGVWDYSNPAALLAQRLGAKGAETGLGPVSGSTVQRMINDAALQIAAGRRDVVVVAGGEAEHSKRRFAKQGIALPWTIQTGSEPDNRFGGDTPFLTRREVELQLTLPAAGFGLESRARSKSSLSGVPKSASRCAPLPAQSYLGAESAGSSSRSSFKR